MVFVSGSVFQCAETPVQTSSTWPRPNLRSIRKGSPLVNRANTRDRDRSARRSAGPWASSEGSEAFHSSQEACSASSGPRRCWPSRSTTAATDASSVFSPASAATALKK